MKKVLFCVGFLCSNVTAEVQSNGLIHSGIVGSVAAYASKIDGKTLDFNSSFKGEIAYKCDGAGRAVVRSVNAVTQPKDGAYLFTLAFADGAPARANIAISKGDKVFFSTSKTIDPLTVASHTAEFHYSKTGVGRSLQIKASFEALSITCTGTNQGGLSTAPTTPVSVPVGHVGPSTLVDNCTVRVPVSGKILLLEPTAAAVLDGKDMFIDYLFDPKIEASPISYGFSGGAFSGPGTGTTFMSWVYTISATPAVKMTPSIDTAIFKLFTGSGWTADTATAKLMSDGEYVSDEVGMNFTAPTHPGTGTMKLSLIAPRPSCPETCCQVPPPKAPSFYRPVILR